METKGLLIWKRILPYLKLSSKPFAVVVIFMLISAASEATFPLFINYAVTNFVNLSTTNGIVLFGICYFAVILIGGASVVVYCRYALIVESTIARDIKRDCFIKLQTLPVSYYNMNSVGYILARVMSDTSKISSIIAWGFIDFLWNFIYLVFATVLMFMLSPSLAIIVAAVLPIAFVLCLLFQQKILVANREMRNQNSIVVGRYNEGISGAKTAKSLVIEDIQSLEFQGETNKLYNSSVYTAKLNAIFIPLSLFFGSVALAAVLVRGGYLMSDDLEIVGIFAAFISYAVAVIEPIQHLARDISEILAAQVNIERVTSLLDEQVSVKDSEQVEQKYGNCFETKPENWENLKGDIEFKDVWFKYPDGTEYVLENFNLSVKKGSTVAIVGETGAGKSTLVNLLCRFFEPTKGQILIDGKDYKDRSLNWLHSNIGYVLQNPHLFSGTIEENILYGNKTATKQQLETAINLVSANKVIDKAQDGLQTEVGESGGFLSAGERQLISFARAVIADPPIFVLDEATATIDTETEQLIQKAIDEVLLERTSFVIAHRLSTIRSADVIIVVRDGLIKEQGTHEQLLQKGGYYSRLYKTMLEK